MISIVDYPTFKINFDEVSRTLIVIDTTSAEVQEDDIRNIISTIEKSILEYKPVNYLTDNKLRKYVFSVEMQEWVANTLLQACLAVDLKKFAVVQPEELVASLYNEQVADEAGESPVQVAFFHTMEQAKNWLGI
jgi:hypothetical protein